MKKGIHPELFTVKARCACGNYIETRSTVPDIAVTLCGACHPFYTGAQKYVDTAGRIEKFQKKFGTKSVKA
jgi:large subunit ribosomal protein L31